LEASAFKRRHKSDGSYRIIGFKTYDAEQQNKF